MNRQDDYRLLTEAFGEPNRSEGGLFTVPAWCVSRRIAHKGLMEGAVWVMDHEDGPGRYSLTIVAVHEEDLDDSPQTWFIDLVESDDVRVVLAVAAAIKTALGLPEILSSV